MGEVLGILIFALVFVLGISYVSTAAMMGHEVAQRTIRFTLILFLLMVPFFLLINLGGKYGLVGFQIFYTVTIIVWLLSWSFRKQKAGILLLDIGKNDDLWVSQVGAGLLWAALAGYNAWSFFRQVPRGNLQYFSIVTKVSDLSFYLSVAIFFILQGFSKTEFRVNGICIGYQLKPRQVV